MSDERISVAELLARGGGADKPAQGGRRRRHRGGENSVTVAELTGEIPVVRDEPADAAQSSAPQQPAPQQSAPQQPAPQQEQPAAPGGAQPAPEENTQHIQAVRDDAPAQSAAPAQPVAPAQPEQAPADEDEDGAPTTSSFLAAAVHTTRADDDAPTVGAADDRAEVVEAEVVDDAAQAGPAGQAAAGRTDTEWNTGERHVEANYAWSQWDDEHAGTAPGMATADFNTAQVRERQARFAEPPAEDTVDVAPVSGVPAPSDQEAEDAAPAVPDTAAMSVQQIDDAREVADREHPAPDFLADADADDDAKAKRKRKNKGKGVEGTGVEDTDVDGAEKGAGRSWLLLIGEVILGIARAPHCSTASSSCGTGAAAPGPSRSPWCSRSSW